MAIIYTYPEINEIEGEDLLLISDTSLYKRPTRSVTMDNLAAYIGSVVGVVQDLQSVLTVGNTYVSPDGYGTFTLNDLANKNGSIKYSNTDEGWGYALNAEEGLNFTDGNGGFDNGKSSFAPYAVWIGNGTHQAQISSNNLTASRIFQLPNASGTIALTSDIPAPGPSGSGTTNYTARWTNASTLGIGALYDNGNYVGIGTNNPTNKLHVYNGITRLDSGSASSNALGVYSNFSNTAINLFANSGSGFISVSSSGMDLGAPWNGGAKVSILNNGNVGIGATSPSEKLEVNGNIRVADEGEIYIQGSTSTRKIVRLDNTSDKGLITLNRSDETKVSISSDINTHGHTYFNGLNVNVGIGTTSPSEKLVVQDGNLIVSGSSSELAIGPAAGKSRIFTNSSKDIRFSTATTNDAVFIKNNNGNVGIGTTSPSEKLHVFSGAAAVKIDSTTNEASLKYDNSTTTANIKLANNDLKTELGGAERMRILANGNVGIGTTSPSQKLHVVGVGSFGTSTSQTLVDYDGLNAVGNTDYIRFKVDNSEKLRIKSSGNVGIGTTNPTANLQLGAFGTANQEFRIESSGNSYFSVLTTDGVQKIYAGGAGTQSNEMAFYTSNSGAEGEAMRITSTGNVGIGTTSPASIMEINGGSGNGVKITAANAGTEFVLNASTSNGTSRLWVGGNGNVGIGTTSPSEKLHVVGYAKTSIGLKAGNYTILSESGNETSLSNTAYYPMFFKTNNSTRMTISNSGNVGIGTTAPGAKLDIIGSAIGLRVKRSDLSDVLRVYTQGSGIYMDNGNVHISDNLGIGTTSPTQKLHVDGNAIISGIGVGTSTIYSNSINITNSGTLRIGNAEFLSKSSNDLSIYQSKINVTSAGNVGIGTTSPSEKLDVRGNIHIEEALPSIIFKRNTSGLQEYSITNEGNFTIEKTTLDSGGSFIIKDENGKTPLDVSMGLLNPDIAISGDLFVKNKTGTTTNLYVKENNGYVGIGTTSPLSKLNVNGDIKIEGENELYFGSSGSVPLWEIKASGSDLVINDTGSNVGSVLFNNDEGIVLPRLTTTEINAISLPNTGLTVYNTTLNTICFYNGSSWQKVSHTSM